MEDPQPAAANRDDDEEEERRARLEAIEQMLADEEEEIVFEADNDAGNAVDAAAANDDVNENEDAQDDDPVVPAIPGAAKKRGWSYVSTSFAAAFCLLYYAFRSRQQFYLTLVYLGSSKFAYVVFGNALVALAIQVFDWVVQAFLTGGLRLQEAEGLQDFFRWNVTESCLALTLFRSELSARVAVEFLILVLMKCLHHVCVLRENHIRLTEEGVVWVETGRRRGGGFPAVPLAHIKVLFFLIGLQLIDLYIVQYTAQDLLARGPSVNVLFAFEAAILLVSAWSHILLWHLHALDGVLHAGHEHGSPLLKPLLHPWKEYKATLTFCVELQAQAIQFFFYLTFFAIVLTYWGMPINLFREVYLSFNALKDRLYAFLKYRRLMASMGNFADVTEEQLEECGRVCIICRDAMHVHDCKQLPCSHIFHKSCLREWLVQQQSCPTCRSDITAMQQRQAQQRAQARAAEERAETEGGAAEGTQGAAAPATTEDAASTTAVAGNAPAKPLAEARRDKKVRFGGEDDDAPGTTDSSAAAAQTEQAAALPRLSCPALFTVVRDEGAFVWSSDSATGNNWKIQRVIPFGVVVLVKQIQQHSRGPALSKPQVMLRVPHTPDTDGWVEEDAVMFIHSM